MNYFYQIPIRLPYHSLRAERVRRHPLHHVAGGINLGGIIWSRWRVLAIGAGKSNAEKHKDDYKRVQPCGNLVKVVVNLQTNMKQWFVYLFLQCTLPQSFDN
jgi:hypothetical protein